MGKRCEINTYQAGCGYDHIGILVLGERLYSSVYGAVTNVLFVDDIEVAFQGIDVVPGFIQFMNAYAGLWPIAKSSSELLLVGTALAPAGSLQGVFRHRPELDLREFWL